MYWAAIPLALTAILLGILGVGTYNDFSICIQRGASSKAQVSMLISSTGLFPILWPYSEFRSALRCISGSAWTGYAVQAPAG